MDIMEACFAGDIERIKILLDEGVDVNYTGWHCILPRGSTLLHLAAFLNHIELVRLLLQRGAKVNITNGHGNTPLCQLTQRQSVNVEVVKILLEHGADVNIASNSKCTPLRHSSNQGQFKIVKLLLENGAKVNVVDFLRCTPLYLASSRTPVLLSEGYLEVVKLLLQYGADPNICDPYGKTPLDICRDPDIIARLSMAVKGQIIWDTWIMETTDYDSLIQWLPREMVEDVLSF